MTYPDRVLLCDVGPRDGFQFEDQPIPTDLKLEIITALANAGVPRLQVTSFVHPEWVPQMADAEDVVSRLPASDDVTYTGLALNRKGLERAHAAGLEHVDLSIATNDQHSRDNANMTVDEAVDQAASMVEYANAHGLRAQVGLQTVFGYAAPGDTPLDEVCALAERFAAMGVESLSLADTTGMANPVMIARCAEAVQAVVGDVPIVLHLHDTRGLGLANVVAALDGGVTRFDTSLAGMGGCPFVPGAAGNIATEDTAYLLRELGIATGVDIGAVAAAAQRIEAVLGKTFPGKIHRLVGRDAAQARV
ncbi:MAG: hydroxymethylglutaryl-CoA lyase [Bacteroidetes bacterium]|jgi:hydroxymethylglutaryl-CoA lyase|nr:hydroxymethylglutaryl-CoA lyase [Bacteroidota bacterium]